MAPPFFIIMRKQFILILFTVVLLCAHIGNASPPDDLSILYFFSATCPHCTAIEPKVTELSKDFSVQGFYFGREVPGSMPFTVRKGDKSLSDKYDINGVPALVILNKGNMKEIIHGEYDIKDALFILKAFQRGALTVSEAVAKGIQGSSHIVGWIESRGDYFRNAHFFITDRRIMIPISPWLPLETVKSPFKTTHPRLMSDIIGKPVELKGALIKADQTYSFIVKHEVIPDKIRSSFK